MFQERVKLEVASNPKLCSLVRKFIGNICELAGFCANEIPIIILAFDEAFTNVIRHTYQMDINQKIKIEVSFLQNDHIEILLIDDGPPIDLNKIKSRSLDEIRPGGLGVHFINEIMDEVEYRPLKRGNILRMFKKISFEECENANPSKDKELLRTLMEIGQSLHQVLHLDKLLKLIVEKVRELMDSEGASVILLDEKKNELVFRTILDEDKKLRKRLQGLRFPANKGIAGRVIQTGEPALVSDVNNDPDHFSEVDKNTGGTTESLIYAPLQTRNRIIGLLSAKNKKKGKFDDADLRALSAIAGTVALSIDNAQAHNELVHTKRIQKEIYAARRMHQATLPQELPEIPNVRADAICKPATEVGGDYYDIFVLEEDLYAFAFGDVSGHGLEAGMMVSMAHSCLYTQIRFSPKILDVMTAMNQLIYGSVKKRLIMTFFYGIYDANSMVLTFANAGHPPFYHYIAKEDKWSLISEGEFPLGIYPDHSYEIYSCQLSQGDFLVFYSDGIIEAINANGDRYGMDRLNALLRSKSWRSARQIREKILKDLRNFCQKIPPNDDRTLMIIQNL